MDRDSRSPVSLIFPPSISDRYPPALETVPFVALSTTGTMSFQYAFIPIDGSIETRRADKSGGLTNDALIATARQHFFALNRGDMRMQELEAAATDPAKHKAIATRIREEMKQVNPAGVEQLNTLTDEQIIEYVKSSLQPTCDIQALTIPTPANQHLSVSLYHAQNGKATGFPLNRRATDLVVACGHQPPEGGIYGDAFVGRAHDDESGVDDTWERVDFPAEDASPSAAWCKMARSPGGGGGSGAASASSLSGLVQQQMKIGDSKSGPVVADLTGDATSSQFYGSSGSPPVEEAWGKWLQSDEEVELRIPVAASVKARDCKIVFHVQSLSVTILGEKKLHGTLFAPVDVDDCTYTFEGGDSDDRVVVVSMGKKVPGNMWTYVAEG